VCGRFACGLTLCHSEKSGEDGSDQMDVDGQVAKKKDKEDLAEYKLDDYDKEPSKKGEHPSCWDEHLIDSRPGGIFSNIKGLTYYKDNEDDPYITLKDVGSKFHVVGKVYSPNRPRKTIQKKRNCKYILQIISWSQQKRKTRFLS